MYFLSFFSDEEEYGTKIKPHFNSIPCAAGGRNCIFLEQRTFVETRATK